MSYRVLLVEDDERMQEIVSDYFIAKGCSLICEGDGMAALVRLERESFDLILLDILMPGLDGFTVCKRIRSNYDTPIVFLTAKSDESDQLYGYELGADDYILKPFLLAVLYAKCMALIKRKGDNNKNGFLNAGKITVIVEEGKTFIESYEIKLPNLEFKILVYFLRNKRKIISREQLLNNIWGYEFEGNDRVVDSHIKKLRKAMGGSARYIKTVSKMGYRFEVNEDEYEIGQK